MSESFDNILPPEMDGLREADWAAAAVKSLFIQEDVSTLAGLVAAGEAKFVSDGRKHYEGQGFSDATLREMFANIKVQVDYVLEHHQEKTELARDAAPTSEKPKNRVITTTPGGTIEEVS